jgi:hypothetical protein
MLAGSNAGGVLALAAARPNAFSYEEAMAELYIVTAIAAGE